MIKKWNNADQNVIKDNVLLKIIKLVHNIVYLDLIAEIQLVRVHIFQQLLCHVCYIHNIILILLMDFLEYMAAHNKAYKVDLVDKHMYWMDLCVLLDIMILLV